VSAPAYDQDNSVGYASADGVPYNKLTVAYYAGTWVDNCNSIGSGAVRERRSRMPQPALCPARGCKHVLPPAPPPHATLTLCTSSPTCARAQGTLGAGFELFDRYGLKGLSIWAVGGASYSGCSTTDAKGFSAALARVKQGPKPPPPGPGPAPGPPGPKTCHAISPQASDAYCQKNCNWKPPNCPASLCKCDP
jgi:hypothetical protein